MRYVAVRLGLILTSMRRILPTPLHSTGLVSRIPRDHGRGDVPSEQHQSAPTAYPPAPDLQEDVN